MRQRFIFLFLLLLAFFVGADGAHAVDPFDTQIVSVFETQRADAFRLFYEGKARSAAIKITEALPLARSVSEAAFLRRDLMEICSESYDWDCVSDTAQELFGTTKAEPSLAKIFSPYVIAKELEKTIWNGNLGFAEQFLKLPRGPFSVANAYSDPVVTAAIQRSLHQYHIRNSNLVAADSDRSAIIHALLLIKPEFSFYRCKIVVSIIASLFDAQDIAGGFAWLGRTANLLDACIPRKSILYAQYKMLAGQLFAFTDAHSVTVSILMEAIKLYEPLEIDLDMKNYQIGTANSIACAALVLDNRSIEAKELHSKHPLKGHEGKIFAKDKFDDLAEFFFAVADIFVAAAIGDKPDKRWIPLFERKFDWDLGELENNNIQSYRVFALALLKLQDEHRDEGSNLLNEVALSRLVNFQVVLKGSLESYQLPSLLDKILIGAGLTNAIRHPSSATPEILLQGSEVIGRNLRHALVDVSSILSQQPDDSARKDAHSYFLLLNAKREWELSRVVEVLSNDPKLPEGGTLTTEYDEVVGTIENLRGKIRTTIAVSGLPNLSNLQNALLDDEAFVAHFPVIGGLGKFCVTRDFIAYAISPSDPTAVEDFKAVEKALSTPPASSDDLRRFPAASAIKLYRILFSGLEGCMQPGMHINIATSPELAGIPFGALLRGDTADVHDFDIRKAPWLIRYFSFSTVISARHLLAIRYGNEKFTASRSYLGIGDPVLRANVATVTANTGEQRLPVMQELPETSEELLAVSNVFGADAEILTRENASEELIRAKSLADYDILHFATHGISPTELPSVGEAGIILSQSGSADEFDDGILTASEIARLSLNSRLVVLSACSTAKYNLAQASRNAQDLQAAFTVAGSPTLLATLWQVDSYAARDIMVAFFRRWKLDGINAARALQQSTLQYLARSEESKQHPWYWSPFVLIGNGEIRPRGSTQFRGASSGSAHLFPEFTSGGEVLDASRLGTDFAVSMFGEWDGLKMNGVISRRDPNGHELWRVASRKIGAGTMTADREGLYVTGYITQPPWTPVLRSLGGSGILRWERQLTDIDGHILSDPIITRDGIYVVSYPFHKPALQDKAAILLFDRNGFEKKRVLIEVDTSGVNIGTPAFIEQIGGSQIIVINIAPNIKIESDGSRWGLPHPCYTGAKSQIYKINEGESEAKFLNSIQNFKTTRLMKYDDSLLFGGELLNSCSFRGIASVVKWVDNQFSTVWKADNIFKTSVTGFARFRDQIAIAISEERSIGIDMRRHQLDAQPDKRWGDNPYASHTSEVIFLSDNGRLIRQEHLSSGLSVFVTKLRQIGQDIVAFGTVGGMPAYWRFR